MRNGPRIETTKDLSEALELLLGHEPSADDPVVLLATYLDALAKGYGLSDSHEVNENQFVKAAPPQVAAPVLEHFLGPGVLGDANQMRHVLYRNVLELADDPHACRSINKSPNFGAEKMLYLAQIYWNLDADDGRSELPIRAGQKIPGDSTLAYILAPGSSTDFARLTYTKRAEYKGAEFKSSGQSFRKQGARLAVISARLIVQRQSEQPPSMPEPILDRDRSGHLRAIVWPESTRAQTPLLRSRESANGFERVVVGNPVAVGPMYQRRSFDAEVEAIWAKDNDRRVWLVGGPGNGKSYSARHVMELAIKDRSDEAEQVLIWVDATDVESVQSTFARALDLLRSRGYTTPGSDNESNKTKAQFLVEELATSLFKWLVVLDNADSGKLIESHLIPAGQNPNGRVLVTTANRDGRIEAHGSVVSAGIFTASESENYVRSTAQALEGGPQPLRDASEDEISVLAETVHYHPLALSIAVSTIIANDLTIPEWVSDFEFSVRMDDVANEPDRGGHATSISSIWRVALAKASDDMSEEVLQRAALVAALQSPSGSPSWVWRSDALLSWVMGKTTSADTRIPMPVRKLIDVGLLEVVGDSWKKGNIALHQLVARAVYEHSNAETVAEAAAHIARQWLLYLTDVLPDKKNFRPIARRNLAKLRNDTHISLETRRMIETVATYAQIDADEWASRYQSYEHDFFIPGFRRGGPSCMNLLAKALVSRAARETNSGNRDAAHAMLEEASRALHTALENYILSDNQRADNLSLLSDIYQLCGKTEEACKVRLKAAGIRESMLSQPYSSANQTDEYIHDIVSPRIILVKLADDYRKLEYGEDLERTIAQLAFSAEIEIETGQRDQRHQVWRQLAEDLRSLNRPVAAATYFARAIELEGESAPDSMPWSHSSLFDMAMLHLEAREWRNAETIFREVIAKSEEADNRALRMKCLPLLASVQLRLDQAKELSTTISTVSELNRFMRRIFATTEISPNDVLSKLSLTKRMVEMKYTQFHIAFLQSRLQPDNDSELIEDANADDLVALSRIFLDVTHDFASRRHGVWDFELADAHLDMCEAYEKVDKADQAVAHAMEAERLLRALVESDATNSKYNARYSDALAACKDLREE